ncbi:MAG TPA: hypothetical protein VFM18_17585 [Methanosarcina sp.]|nr:hypothetical protein [Methanosarcina sp.]
MFTRTSKYERDVQEITRACREAIDLGNIFRQKYENALRKYNALVDRINRLGGEEFLRTGEAEQKAGTQQFSKEEINTLIALCHPDKHGNKESATRITQKLLKMRG